MSAEQLHVRCHDAVARANILLGPGTDRQQLREMINQLIVLLSETLNVAEQAEAREQALSKWAARLDAHLKQLENGV